MSTEHSTDTEPRATIAQLETQLAAVETERARLQSRLVIARGELKSAVQSSYQPYEERELERLIEHLHAKLAAEPKGPTAAAVHRSLEGLTASSFSIPERLETVKRLLSDLGNAYRLDRAHYDRSIPLRNPSFKL